ncbi:MAG: YfgM family protein [Gammaproteobacteria bacterium]
MQTEEEQLAEIKRWWTENGKTVITGLVIGLGGVLGYNSWQAHQRGQAEQASALYEEVVDTVSRDEHEQVLRQVDTLINDFSGTGYAKLGALIGARSAYASGNAARAVQLLEWTIDQADAPALKDLARLRLARLHVDAGSYDQARASIDAITGTGFKSFVDEAKGDIADAEGDSDAAGKAYELALADESIPAASRNRVQMKLDALGHLKIE